MATQGRGEQQWHKYSPEEQLPFDDVIGSSQSFQEATYNWYSLAAGHSMSYIQTHAYAIRGKGPPWL